MEGGITIAIAPDDASRPDENFSLYPALRNGLLRIELLRELPETKKPRKIQIDQDHPKGASPRLLGKDQSAA